MRRAFEILLAIPLLVIALWSGRWASMIGRNLYIDWQNQGRMTGYGAGLGELMVTGWMMYAYPLVLIIACAALLYCGLTLLFPRRPTR